MNRLDSPFSKLMEYWFDEMVDAFTRNLRTKQKEEAAAMAFDEVVDKAANQHYMMLVQADPATSFMCYVNKRFQEHPMEDGYENFKMGEFLEKSELAKQIQEQFEDTDKLLSTKHLNEAIKNYQTEKNNLSAEDKKTRREEIEKLNERVEKDKETIAKFFDAQHEISFDKAPDELKELATLFLEGKALEQFNKDTDYIFSKETMELNKKNPNNTMDSLYKHRWTELSEKDKLQVSGEVRDIMFDNHGKPRSILDMKEDELAKMSSDGIYAAMKMQFISSVAPSLLKEFDRTKGNIFRNSKRDYEFEVFGDKLSTKELLKNSVMYSLKTNEETRSALNYKIPQVNELRNIIGQIHEKDVNADKAMTELVLEPVEEKIEEQEKYEPSEKTVKDHKEAMMKVKARENGPIGSMDARNKSEITGRSAYRIPKQLQKDGKVGHYIPKHRSNRLDPYELELDNRLKSAKEKDYAEAKREVLKECDTKLKLYNQRVEPDGQIKEAYKEVDKMYDAFKKEYLAENKNEINKDNFYLHEPTEENKVKMQEIINELSREELLAVKDKIDRIPDGIMKEMTCLNNAKEKIQERVEKESEKERERDEPIREKEE